MVTYPHEFPCASRGSYSATSGMAVQRTPFEAGNARQRRIHFGMPHLFRLEFVMPQARLNSWQPWVNEHAYAWFTLELASYAAGGDGYIPHTVRFIGDLELQLLNVRGLFFWRVAVDAEWLPATDGVPLFTGRWIISNHPATAPADWISGGSPPFPSIDWIRAGKPGRPAVLVP